MCEQAAREAAALVGRVDGELGDVEIYVGLYFPLDIGGFVGRAGWWNRGRGRREDGKRGEKAHDFFAGAGPVAVLVLVLVLAPVRPRRSLLWVLVALAVGGDGDPQMSVVEVLPQVLDGDGLVVGDGVQSDRAEELAR